METAMQLSIHHPKEREKRFEELYEEVFPLVAKIISRQGGSFQDTKDVFQDALVIYYEKAVSENEEGIIAPEAYLIGIAKHLWLRKVKNENKRLVLSELEQAITLPDDYFDSTQNNRLLVLLEHTGKKCLELLRAFYYDKLSMSMISSAFGFSSDHSAAAQKYKCIEKIRNTIKDKSMSYEDFIE